MLAGCWLVELFPGLPDDLTDGGPGLCGSSDITRRWLHVAAQPSMEKRRRTPPSATPQQPQQLDHATLLLRTHPPWLTSSKSPTAQSPTLSTPSTLPSCPTMTTTSYKTMTSPN